MSERIGIIISGGPAPGINCAIASCVIEAERKGFTVIGINDGFEGAAAADASAFKPLTTTDVSRIHTSGGSILGTSRFNPLASAKRLTRFKRNLESQHITKLIVIGGDGSAFITHSLCRQITALQVLHLPKTIDNDLPLPGTIPSFGFETAREIGTSIVETLMVDAKTTKRFFIVTTMGRRAGYLALGIGVAAGATLTLIPEEFKESTSIESLTQQILRTVEKRLASNKPYGVIILAEGIIHKLDQHCPELSKVPKDDLGRIKLSSIELGELLLPYLARGSANLSTTPAFTGKNIGYELRCHDPLAFDIEYTRLLGFYAIKYISSGISDALVVRDHDRFYPLPFAELFDKNGVIKTRSVDLSSDYYRAAEAFMIK